MVLPAPETWIHHTANAMPGDHQPDPDEIKEMQAIQNYHMDVKGWSDIAYSFVIFDDGSIYEGRGWGIKGGHTENHNSISHGICFAGNFELEKPTLLSLDSCRWLIARGIELGKIAKGTQPTGGHRDTKPTACPGDNLYAKLSYLRQPWEDEVTREELAKLLGIPFKRLNEFVQAAMGVADWSENRPSGDIVNAFRKNVVAKLEDAAGSHEHKVTGKAA
jgi:N-acetylmuramoyl-L-alanine amidase